MGVYHISFDSLWRWYNGVVVLFVFVGSAIRLRVFEDLRPAMLVRNQWWEGQTPVGCESFARFQYFAILGSLPNGAGTTVSWSCSYSLWEALWSS
jgi:hypothetical protein